VNLIIEMGQKMEKFGKNVVFPEKYFFMKSSEFRVQSSEFRVQSSEFKLFGYLEKMINRSVAS
jgi:hypothetical protein